MKKLVITTIIALLAASWSIARAQDFPEEYLGLPGDNLNLYAVMKMFQESETLEEFERNLNDENSRINNLDLNGDKYVDYIMVKDYPDGNVHNIVLRAALNENETQDVAVFIVQQFNDGSVQLQLIGDEALYGKNYIIEPYYAEGGETPNPAYVGNAVARNNATVVKTTTYEVAAWPVVRYIYQPGYSVWRSSWHWGYYPSYWSAWRPFYWHTYYGYHYHWHDHYYSYYRPWNNIRYSRYNTVYYSRVRNYSPTVVVNINKGVYSNTYSRPDLRVEGEKLYARTNSGRSSVNTNARVKTDNSSSVLRSGTRTNSSTGRREAGVTTGRTATKSAAEVRSNTSRRSAGTVSGRSATGTSVTRSGDNQRKSATVNTERATRSTSSGNVTGTTRRATPASSGSSTTRPSVQRSSEIKTKSGATAPRTATPAPSVRQSRSSQPSGNTSGRSSSPSVRQSTSTRPSATVSGRSSTRSQPAVKSAPSRSSSRSSGTSVSSPRSSSRSSSATSSGSSSRSSSSSRSGRR